MLSIETRINEKLISSLHIQREGAIDDPKREYDYSVEYRYGLDREAGRIHFEIKHRYNEGAEKLVLLVYQEIDKRLKKENCKRV